MFMYGTIQAWLAIVLGLDLLNDTSGARWSAWNELKTAGKRISNFASL